MGFSAVVKPNRDIIPKNRSSPASKESPSPRTPLFPPGDIPGPRRGPRNIAASIALSRPDRSGRNPGRWSAGAVFPPLAHLPLVGARIPAIRRSGWLPTPLRPMMPRVSPHGFSDTRSSTWCEPWSKDFRRDW